MSSSSLLPETADGAGAEQPGRLKRMVTRSNSALDAYSEKVADLLNWAFPHPSVDKKDDAYSRACAKAAANGCDPVTGAPNTEASSMTPAQMTAAAGMPDDTIVNY
mmetsp:Transcript_36222/g.112080  ORF Transcript_36222/g.112080 Transcript_36222/m.112080 type:complete len:106 (+) Transcript_36222:265-582(+)